MNWGNQLSEHECLKLPYEGGGSDFLHGESHWGCPSALNVLRCIEDGIKPLNKIDPLGVFSGQVNIIGDE